MTCTNIITILVVNQPAKLWSSVMETFFYPDPERRSELCAALNIKIGASKQIKALTVIV